MKMVGIKRGDQMQLSTRGRYGLKAMYELALHHGEGPTPLNEIAERQNVSESYLEQLFLTLRKDKLIKSVRGAYGGYLLDGEPEDITVGQVLRSLEGSMSPTKCLDETEKKCEQKSECATKFVWEKLKNSIDEVIDGISLADMIDIVDKKS